MKFFKMVSKLYTNMAMLIGHVILLTGVTGVCFCCYILVLNRLEEIKSRRSYRTW